MQLGIALAHSYVWTCPAGCPSICPRFKKMLAEDVKGKIKELGPSEKDYLARRFR